MFPSLILGLGAGVMLFAILFIYAACVISGQEAQQAEMDRPAPGGGSADRHFSHRETNPSPAYRDMAIRPQA